MTLNRNAYYVKFALRDYFTLFIIIFHLDLYKTNGYPRQVKYRLRYLFKKVSPEIYM